MYSLVFESWVNTSTTEHFFKKTEAHDGLRLSISVGCWGPAAGCAISALTKHSLVFPGLWLLGQITTDVGANQILQHLASAGNPTQPDSRPSR